MPLQQMIVFSIENRFFFFQKRKSYWVCSLSHLQDGKGGWYAQNDADSSLWLTISSVNNRSTPLKQPVKKSTGYNALPSSSLFFF
jgi:hypothetical protein